MKSTWSVAVIYEGADVRQTAIEFSDRLVERFWSRVGFDFSWVPYEALADKAAAGTAARQAAQADLVVFATTLHHEPLPPFKAWLDDWLRLRAEKEGTLVALTVPAPAAGTCPVSQSFFRQVAHQAGMDFACELPQSIPFVSDSAESYSTRASEVTSVLDGILHQPHRPTVL